ncbi:hypothetical protein C427_3002 [Paraglaciecola psychrophila 170]|uniref:Uncharacterized protein n=1 Tax=Paraglaciecola psychrophila 170 TaxID=1129794 RepID=M4RNH4_9ALTE|nr:hypothetical protein C427_3002 [Paraglaciecola psychrophila 170]
MHGPMGESTYTKSANNLVRHIQSNTPIKDSLFEHAQLYFETSDKDKQTCFEFQKKLKALKIHCKQQIRKLKQSLTKISMLLNYY